MIWNGTGNAWKRAFSLRALHVTSVFAIALQLSCSIENDRPMADRETPVPVVPDGPLGDLAVPRHYELFMRIDPREEGFSASVAIDIDMNRGAAGIWLHGRDLEVSKISLVQNDTRSAASYEQKHPTGVSYVGFGRVVEPGPIRLEIEYAGKYDLNLSGMFKVEEQGESYVLAKSESIQARRFVIGFDEPGFKATWDVSLEIPAGYVAIANGPESNRRAAGPGLERVDFERVRPTSTFLLSLAVGPFEVIEFAPIPPNEIRSTPIPLRGIARQGKAAELEAILALTAPMLATFERALRQPYPYPKLDVVAAPAWPSGATELAAAPTYREQVILLGEDPSPGAVLRMQSIHAHELAHMWFGNLVTPPWWDDLWLKEGFATWGTPTALVAIDPDGGHDLTSALRYLGAMELDGLASARAIREPVTSNATVRSAYDSITYSKSLAMLTMVDNWFGPERFRPALGRYIAANADGAADSDAFYAEIGDATGEPRMTRVFRSFVEQNGLPLVSARLECASEPAIVLTQRRYAPPGSAIDPQRNWSIPLCVRHASGTVCEVLEAGETRIELATQSCPDWFVANAGGTGYFRVEVSAADWEALQRNWTALTPRERIMLFDSLAAQSVKEPLLAPLADAMAKQMALSGEWQAAIQPFAYWTERLRFAAPDEAVEFRRSLTVFLREQRLQPVTAATNSEQRLFQYRLQNFLATTLEDPAMQRELADALRTFLAGDAGAISSDQYFAAVYSLLQTDSDGFATIVAARRSLDDPRFEDASARALGSAAGGRVGETLEYLFSDEVGGREAYGGLMAAAGEDPLQTDVWNWFVANHDRVAAKIPAQWVGRLPAIGSGICEEELGAEWQAWMSRWVEETPSAKRSIAETGERIRLCVARKSVLAQRREASAVG